MKEKLLTYSTAFAAKFPYIQTLAFPYFSISLAIFPTKLASLCQGASLERIIEVSFNQDNKSKEERKSKQGH